MKKRTIAIVTSVAALSFAAAPIASAATTHAVSRSDRLERVRDASLDRHSTDRRGSERSRDVRSLDRSRDASSVDR